jgi:hypothetical protein
MKRLQLFELEDQAWFPDVIRASMTRMLTILHGWLKSPHRIALILSEVIQVTGRKRIVDLCSGDGGPMIAVLQELHRIEGMHDVSLTLTDLYPNQSARKRIASSNRTNLLEYCEQPVDAARLEATNPGTIRTLIAGFHHMPPDRARAILRHAVASGDPLLIYELSDNKIPPKYLWWVGLPLNLILAFVVAARVRPMSFTHFCLSFVIPVVPICFAWDGAVSNARTYTAHDLNELLSGLEAEGYVWNIRSIGAKPANQLCLLGMPVALEEQSASAGT